MGGASVGASPWGLTRPIEDHECYRLWGGVSPPAPWPLGGLWVTMGVLGGGEETPLSAVRPRGKGVPPSWALDISGSPHLTIGYLLRG